MAFEPTDAQILAVDCPQCRADPGQHCGTTNPRIETPPCSDRIELARIESMPDEELLAEARARGVDVVEQAKLVKQKLLDACKRARGTK